LLFQTGFVEIEEALDFVGIERPVVGFGEEGLVAVERVDDHLTGFSALGRFEGGVDLADEGIDSDRSVPSAAMGIDDEVETRIAEEVDAGEVVSGTKGTAHGDRVVAEIAQAVFFEAI
jgi:hypothetical protein